MALVQIRYYFSLFLYHGWPERPIRHVFSCRFGYAPCRCRRGWITSWCLDLYGWPDHAARN